jgi:hypothetical protein
VRAVREHAQFLLERVADALPHTRQIVFIDEPSIVDIGDADFPVAPDTAIDLMSGALAAIETHAVAGVHCCAPVDVGLLAAAGPAVLSIPVRAELVDEAAVLGRFLADGGVVAWGAVPTGGPIPHSSDRPWRQLAELWCGLVAAGIDPGVLRTQAIVTPECGLGMHSPSVSDRVFAITADVARKVHDQATASRWVLGA